MSLRAFATPDSLTSSFKDLDVDIGPRVEHVYDVINHGPYDVGHLIVSIKFISAYNITANKCKFVMLLSNFDGNQGGRGYCFV